MADSVKALDVLVVDDEERACDELAYLLQDDARIGSVTLATSGMHAFQEIEHTSFDAVFLDIAMPCLSGLDVARVLRKFEQPPAIVFITGFEAHAVEAFDLQATDFLLKPMRRQRVRQAVGRVLAERTVTSSRIDSDETLSLERGGVTHFIRRSEVRYAEAHGDYVRLHTEAGAFLMLTSLTRLEERWRSADFVRINRRMLVPLGRISEARFDPHACTVTVGGDELTVSRRHVAGLRDLLLRQRPSA